MAMRSSAGTKILQATPTDLAGLPYVRPAYAALRRHLIELLSSVKVSVISRKTKVVDRLIRSAADAYARSDNRMAAEIFSLATETDSLNETAFLGAGLASFDVNRISVARAYLVQARTLHQHVGARTQISFYDSMIAAIDGLPDATEDRDEVKPYIAGDEESPWYWSYARRHPKRVALKSIADFDAYFLDGLVPPAPIIKASDQIATIGSCFAENLSKLLAQRGYTHHLFVQDYFFTTYVLREAFEYAFGCNETREHWVKAAGPAQTAKTMTNRRASAYSVDQVRATLELGDAYVITLGLAEIWYNRETSAVYPSGLHIDAFDPERHGFRVSTVEENLANIEAIYRIIRDNRGPVPVVFTVSPVTLAATFRDFNCVAANAVSKAILRLAVDQLLEKHRDDENLFYFPSYEIARDYFVDAFMEDMRHIKTNIVKFIVEQFCRKFIIEPPSEGSAQMA